MLGVADRARKDTIANWTADATAIGFVWAIEFETTTADSLAPMIR